MYFSLYQMDFSETCYQVSWSGLKQHLPDHFLGNDFPTVLQGHCLCPLQVLPENRTMDLIIKKININFLTVRAVKMGLKVTDSPLLNI